MFRAALKSIKSSRAFQYLHPLAVRIVGTPKHGYCVYPETQVAIGKHTETKISLRAQRASRKALLNGRSITRFHQLHETLHVHEAILSTMLILTEEWLIIHGMDSTTVHHTCTRRNEEQLCRFEMSVA
jgi:hypothetical protein